MHPSGWQLDTDRWPGPDRARWGISRDIVVPSPDGRFACVLYSCCEVRLGCEAGLLTLLEGPPDSPTVLFQPARFTCFDFSPARSVEWFGGGRFAIVTAYLYRPTSNRVDLLALTFLDTGSRAFATREIPLSQAGRWSVDPLDDWVLSAKAEPRDRLDSSQLAPSLQWHSWETARRRRLLS